MAASRARDLVLRWFVPAGLAACWGVLLSLALRAWAKLGHFPRMDIDDPKALGLGWHYELTGSATLVGAVLTVFAGFWALGLLLVSGRKAFPALAPTIAATALSALLYRLTPLVLWYLD